MQDKGYQLVQKGIDDYAERLRAYAEDPKRGRYPPTLYLGLGGTGAKALLHLRRLIMERFGGVDALEGIAFLSIDTDISSFEPSAADSSKVDPFKAELKFREHERVNLKASITGLIGEQGLQNNPHIREWWDPSLNLDDNFPLEKGAGQIRPLGRLTVFANRDTILDKLKSAHRRVTSANNRSNRINTEEGVRFVVVASWAGGTGAGTFVDIAALIRHAFKHSTPAISVDGIFALPGVFVGAENAHAKLAANGFACLREVNNYRTNPFRVAYTSNAPPEESQLYDRCVLFSGQNVVGQTLGKDSDCYRAIGESLFLDFSAGPMRGWIEGVRVNRRQYLQSFVHYPYNARGRTGGDETISSERFYTFFSSFGMAKLAFPSWRFLNYARFDLASEMVGMLDPARGGGANAVNEKMLKEFMFELGIFQGKKLDDLGQEQEHRQVRDRVLRLVGADGNPTSIPAAIEQRAAMLVDAAEAMFEDRCSRKDCESAWREAGKLIGDPGAPGHEGQWIRDMRKNRDQYIKEVAVRLPELVEKYRKLPGMGPSGVVALLDEVLATLRRDHDKERYAKWYAHRVAVEETAKKEAEAKWKNFVDNTVRTEAAMWPLRSADNHREAVRMASEELALYHKARINIELSTEAQAALGEIEGKLGEQRKWLLDLADGLTALRNQLTGYRDFYRTAEASSLFPEIPTDVRLDKLLEPYLGSTAAERVKRLEFLQGRCLDTLNLKTLAAIRQKLDGASDELRVALAASAFEALKGDEHGKTSHFGADQEPKDGFIQRYSAVKMLKDHVKDPSALRQMLEDLYRRALPWTTDAKVGAVTDYRAPTDAFIGFIDKDLESTGRLIETIVDQTRHGTYGCQRVQIADPSEIILYTEVNAFPAYFLGEIQGASGMRACYEELVYNPNKPAPVHIHQAYHAYPDVVPASSQEMQQRLYAWKAFVTAQMLGIIVTVKLRHWDERTCAFQHKTKEDFQTKYVDLATEGSAIRRIERDHLRFMQQLQDQIEKTILAMGERGLTLGHLAVLADYWFYCVFPVQKSRESGAAGAVDVTGSMGNLAAAALRDEWAKLATQRGHAPPDPAALMRDLDAWTMPVSRQRGGPVPLTPEIPEDSRMFAWDFMDEAVGAVSRMRAGGLIRETRDKAGRIEIGFPRLAINPDAFTGKVEHVKPPPEQKPTPPLEPAPELKPPPEMSLHYQVDKVAQGAGPMPIQDIARSVNASPHRRHRVYHQKAWKDARDVPEIEALLLPADVPPDDEVPPPDDG